MTKQQVDYDQIAPEYDQRFASSSPDGRVEALRALVESARADRILEVGCGTGHWLASLALSGCEGYGLDASTGMLGLAQQRGLRLVRGYARQLPFEDGAFDVVYCVNAIHHFAKPRGFVHEAVRVLRASGVLAICGSDPHRGSNRWYLYDYFEGTYEADLQRFPSWQDVQQWMAEAGLCNVELREVEQIVDDTIGRDVLDDVYLRKNACSQLALLTDSAYAAGVQEIRSALAAAEAAGVTMVFATELSIEMITGRK